MKSRKSIPSIDARLKAIRNAINDTVVIKVGLTKTGEVDILSVKNLLVADTPEDAETPQQAPKQAPIYIG